ncbi:hypothetical protein N7481_007809 [Penicillium waksmanii]|uniref:uncharacterized protein n=1 Tax=Penicillium waksmanii TaxID=69791 RepID=UPI0025467995|nr:uncharacterized protein N7481_007809 [Penicillium waksmanii]KAJ5980511.1 hypothetical protein N7481_007809 [Penicillium waksmanii]
MAEVKFTTLCLLGCGNLGGAILDSLLNATEKESLFTKFIACVRSQSSEEKLAARFSQHLAKLTIKRGDNTQAVREADVIILGVDPSDIESVLSQQSLREALGNKLLISIAAGWTRRKLEQTIYGSETTNANKSDRAWVVRTLPNIAAQVSQSLTAIEVSEPAPPAHYLTVTNEIFERIGKAVQIDPRLMNATTAVGGIDTGYSMQGTAAMLQSGIHPALLKDQGTSPEGCTIGGLMVMEEAGVRGSVGRALREAVTLARLMETQEHVNDTRR